MLVEIHYNNPHEETLGSCRSSEENVAQMELADNFPRMSRIVENDLRNKMAHGPFFRGLIQVPLYGILNRLDHLSLVTYKRDKKVKVKLYQVSITRIHLISTY